MTALTDIILPHKERFTLNNAGVSLHRLAGSGFLLALPPLIFGFLARLLTPLYCQSSFMGLTAKSSWLRSQTKQFVTAYLSFLLGAETQPDIIEVHGRLEAANG